MFVETKSKSMLVLALMTLGVNSLLYLGHDWTGVSLDYWWAWEIPVRFGPGLLTVWPMFVWGAGISGLVALAVIIRKHPRTEEPWPAFFQGIINSLRAGIFEEIIFRWLLLLGAPTLLKFFDWFGWLEWLYTQCLIPLANTMTLGILEPQLHSANWLIGASIVSASASFRNQHEHLGLFGYINSWFMGMVLFYLVFNYGMVTAMAAHFLYDLIVFTISAVSQKFRPASRLSYLDLLGKRI